jgi:hypothetical protein
MLKKSEWARPDFFIGIRTRFGDHTNTQNAEDCKLAPANPIMPRLNYFSFFLEAGVVGQIG